MDFNGQTALVTGASSGIGQAFAYELAARGVKHIILVALSKEELAVTAQKIKESSHTTTSSIAIDLSREDAPDIIAKQVQAEHQTIGILVNAAGFGTRGPSHTLNLKTEHAELIVNAATVAQLTYLFLPRMVEQKRGIIVNVGSSSASFWPGPTMAMYGATKAFVLSFTEALWGEYHDKGLHITALCPAPTDTHFHTSAGFAANGTVSPAIKRKKRTPEQAVAAAFHAIEKGRPYIVDTTSAYLRSLLPRLLPVKTTIAIAKKSLQKGL